MKKKNHKSASPPPPPIFGSIMWGFSAFHMYLKMYKWGATQFFAFGETLFQIQSSWTPLTLTDKSWAAVSFSFCCLPRSSPALLNLKIVFLIPIYLSCWTNVSYFFSAGMDPWSLVIHSFKSENSVFFSAKRKKSVKKKHKLFYSFIRNSSKLHKNELYRVKKIRYLCAEWLSRY